MPYKISRAAYASMFGPTTGDKVRLADTELFIEIEKDFTTYGEEVKFGGGKVIRDGMGQSQATRAQGAVDTVITNAVVIDHSGIYKADIGLKNGRIAAIGKAGNPDTQPGVNIIVGPSTEAIAGEGKIITAGGIDCHIHFIAPQQIDDAPASTISSSAAGSEALPLPASARFIGKPSKLSIIRSICQAPVQVVASVPCAGPVPPPSMQVTPDISASSICCGQM